MRLLSGAESTGGLHAFERGFLARTPLLFASRGSVLAVVLASIVMGPWLAGCTRQADAVVDVQVGMWGGPVRPTGGMALQGEPAPGVNVTARDAHGKTWDGTTDQQGVAQLQLRPGAYVIFSTYCGPTEDAAPVTTLQSGDIRSIEIHCDVP